ncbi:hypothetical protein KC909_01440 [Candidatus Dojkabacteria bacterium]|uniref:Uncharacterized protein n=1 Tax=Candidatus Dojkabacteria bacterium TaxID=2099670 RepID=A0A955L4Y7_9BACT|nr:hypothetical protein [Candidatus Dojkabacteria bacterium]
MFNLSENLIYLKDLSIASLVFALLVVLMFIIFLGVRYTQYNKDTKKLMKDKLVRRAIRDLYVTLALVILSSFTLLLIQFKFGIVW